MSIYFVDAITTRNKQYIVHLGVEDGSQQRNFDLVELEDEELSLETALLCQRVEEFRNNWIAGDDE